MDINIFNLPYEILEMIVLAIDSPNDYICWNLACREFNNIGQNVIDKKMMQFIKKVKINIDDKHIHEFCVLPNGTKIGEHKIWLYPLEHDENPNVLPVLVSHTWITNEGSEVKAYWTTGNCRLFQDWYHYPANQLMTEHKTFDTFGKLKDIKYSVTFSDDLTEYADSDEVE